MTEDRPQYQAANKSFVDPTPTPIELAQKLRYLSNDEAHQRRNEH